MTTTEFLEYLCSDERTCDVGAELCGVLALQHALGNTATKPARVRVPA